MSPILGNVFSALCNGAGLVGEILLRPGINPPDRLNASLLLRSPDEDEGQDGSIGGCGTGGDVGKREVFGTSVKEASRLLRKWFATFCRHRLGHGMGSSGQLLFAHHLIY